MGWFDWIKDAGNAIVDNVAKPVYNNVIIPVYDTVVQPVIDVVVKPSYNKLYDWATSDQVECILESAKEVGITVGDEFCKGADAIHSGLSDDIKEILTKGWQETTDWVSENYCQLGVSTAVTMAVGTVITTERELQLGEKIAQMAVNSTNNFELKKRLVADFSRELAGHFVDTLYKVPGVPGSKDELKDVIAFNIYKSLIKDNFNITSPKDFFGGALTCGITSYVCDGSVPKGFQNWKMGIY